LINNNYLYNFIKDYTACEIKTNLWYHAKYGSGPYFHVDDNAVQQLFANECIAHINNYKDTDNC